MKKFVPLFVVIAILFSFFLSGCQSLNSSFSEPPTSSSALSFSDLTVDWDKAIDDAYSAMSEIYTGDKAGEKPPSLAVSVEENLIRVSYPDMGGRSGKDIYDSYMMLDFANNLLRSLNDAAKLQDDRIEASDDLFLGSVYDSFDLSIVIGEMVAPFINDTLKAGELRTRGLRLIDVPVSVDIYSEKARDAINAQLNAIVEQDSRFEGLFASLYFDFPFLDLHEATDNDVTDLELFLSITLNEDIRSPETALEYTEDALRIFNEICRQQDPSLAPADKDSYGGIYDKVHLELMAGINNLSAKDVSFPITHYEYHFYEDGPFKITEWGKKFNPDSRYRS